MRVTKADIYQVQDVINGVLERRDHPDRVYVEWAYGQPRAYWQPVGETYVKDLSPRLPTGQMYQWLHAFAEGLGVPAGGILDLLHGEQRLGTPGTLPDGTTYDAIVADKDGRGNRIWYAAEWDDGTAIAIYTEDGYRIKVY